MSVAVWPVFFCLLFFQPNVLSFSDPKYEEHGLPGACYGSFCHLP